jgi:nucleoside-triphosphatase THEP1
MKIVEEVGRVKVTMKKVRATVVRAVLIRDETCSMISVHKRDKKNPKKRKNLTDQRKYPRKNLLEYLTREPRNQKFKKS